jgi:predicted PurR-regulated permease PerM/GAF domain-containing protein
LLNDANQNLKRTDNALLTGILVVVVLYFAREVLVPLALAGLIAFVLAAAASRLERWGMRRAPAALLVIFFSLSAMAVLGWALMGQIYSLAKDLPQYQENVTGKIESLHLDSAGQLSATLDMLNSVNKRLRSGNSTPIPSVFLSPQRTSRSHAKPNAAASQTPATVPVRIEQPDESVLELAGKTMSPLLRPVATTFIVVIFLVFMLIGREDLRDRGLKLAGTGRMHATTSAIKDATARVSRYLQMQMIVNLSYGAVAGLGLSLIGIPHPLLWGVLTCVLRFVPYVGIMMAAAGPILLAGAASPRWNEMIWTVILYAVVEAVVANWIEPMLYGASTGISAIAVLIAAVFWTFLWGLPGLLLSTPLTVCLIVIGRQVPRLRYLEVLLGERTGLPPSEHFYQRMLASKPRDARALVETTLKTRSRAEVYDSILIPALSMIEEARHSEEMTPTRGEEVLQSIEELVEELNGASTPESARRVLCIPARDLADEIACQLAEQVLEDTASVHVVAADSSMAQIQELAERLQPDAVCVTGIPPSAVRYIRMRCHQIRSRFPQVVVVACVLGQESDLSSLRSRISADDAQHVVCSLQLLRDYLSSLFGPPAEAPATEGAVESSKELTEDLQELSQLDPFDGPAEGMFNRLASSLARSFDAPIALITAGNGQQCFWEAQCGLPESALSRSLCDQIVFWESVCVVGDTAQEERFVNDSFLKDQGIRFYAGAPLKSHDGKLVGTVCVLDTRPRQITGKQKEILMSVAESVMMAIELMEPMRTAPETA